MTDSSPSAAERVFGTPELLELILCSLLTHTVPITIHEDPRSVRVHHNANILRHLLRCTQINRTWYRTIYGSTFLQRALFFHADHTTERTWTHPPTHRRVRPGDSCKLPSIFAPQLNPLIQTTFASYHFRYWSYDVGKTGHKHCAYLVISRRDLLSPNRSGASDSVRKLSDMLLAQPPCTALEATVWDCNDTRDSTAQTTALQDPTIWCDGGVRLGLVHERVREWFERHQDVIAVKLMTV